MRIQQLMLDRVFVSFRSAMVLRRVATLSLALVTAGSFAQTAQEEPAAQAPSTLLRPALESVGRAGSAVDLNKWKGPNATREEVDANLASLQKDLQSTLPALLSAADAAPASPAATLPVLLNLDALYSVLLRVTIASRNGAPRDENTALEQSAVLLDSARRDLGDAILAAASAQEKRTAALQATVQQQAAALSAANASPPTPVPAPAKPKRKKSSSAAKPAQ